MNDEHDHNPLTATDIIMFALDIANRESNISANERDLARNFLKKSIYANELLVRWSKEPTNAHPYPAACEAISANNFEAVQPLNGITPE